MLASVPPRAGEDVGVPSLWVWPGSSSSECSETSSAYDDESGGPLTRLGGVSRLQMPADVQ